MVRKQKPNWWLLYLTVPLMLALLVLESQIPYSLVFHRIVEFAIVLLGFGLMFVWVRANEGAMINEEREKEWWVIQPDPSVKESGMPPFGEGRDDAGGGHHHPEPSAIKGRYN